MSIFSLPVPILYYFFVPESYRILIAHGKLEEAKKVMTPFLGGSALLHKLNHQNDFFLIAKALIAAKLFF